MRLPEPIVSWQDSLILAGMYIVGVIGLTVIMLKVLGLI